MSYDISLYDRVFLRRALESGLGDWTGADPIPPAAVEALVRLALEAGFRRVEPDPSWVSYLAKRGRTPAQALRLDTPELLAELNLHPGQLAFSVPYSDCAAPSVALCLQLARAVAEAHDLALYDPQEGEDEE
jgi:hypothetical protein